ncbi:hypothetical protein SAMN05421736_10896 [Evansella caseinilytica]|uniref:Uncharacterized protein n=1 Tax=Evansella caseinilytica TaxID=1503961 RepID=A0A1H3RIS4_9BACI|nr:hypothetical protein SAMN05421736_10896 [Evansella caseinilytica]
MTDFYERTDWEEVGWGALKLAGGGFQMAGGGILATGGTAASGGLLAGITIGAGGLLFVDGFNNVVAGGSQAWNALAGNDKGEYNVIKNVFETASPDHGEEYYNYYQLGVTTLCLGISGYQLATATVRTTYSSIGFFRVQQEGVKIGYKVVDKSIKNITINYMTETGLLYKTVQINTGLMLSGSIDIVITTINAKQ